ncbi:DNA binding protein vP5 [Microviridae sp.]|nr:DNA binding protein vP5 [Microviridae sp.]
MKLLLCAIYDSKIEAFEKPIFFRSLAEALRAWSTVCNDAQSPMSQYPEDFVLFQLGEVDLSSGSVHPFEAPRAISKGIEVKKVDAGLKLMQSQNVNSLSQ